MVRWLAGYVRARACGAWYVWPWVRVGEMFFQTTRPVVFFSFMYILTNRTTVELVWCWYGSRWFVMEVQTTAG